MRSLGPLDGGDRWRGGTALEDAVALLTVAKIVDLRDPRREGWRAVPAGTASALIFMP